MLNNFKVKDYTAEVESARVLKTLEDELNRLVKLLQEEDNQSIAWGFVGHIYALVMFAQAAGLITYEELKEFYEPVREYYYDRVYSK